MNYLKSKSFQNALRKAAGIATSKEKISVLVTSVTDKMSDMDENKKNVNEFFEKVKTFLRMLRAYIRGEYRQIPFKSLLMIIGALIYFMMPIDLIPDFIPAMGLADDISILFLVFNSINEDVEAFLDFELSGKSKVKES